MGLKDSEGQKQLEAEYAKSLEVVATLDENLNEALRKQEYQYL